MSNEDSDDICTDGDCPKEVLMTGFSNLSNKETLITEKCSSYMTRRDLPTVKKMLPTITISKEEYEYLCAELKSKDQKLKALKNIHLLIQEKDEEVSSLKERNQTYADALMMSETRHCQLLRIATQFAKENAGSNTDQKQKTSSTDDSAKLVSLQNSEIENPKDTGNIQHTVEEDSEKLNCEIHATGLTQDSGHANTSLEIDAALVGDGLTFSHLKSSFKETDHSLNRSTFDDTVQQTTEPSDQAESVQGQVLNPRGLPMPIHVYAVPRKYAGVSQDLVSKLVKQNARLKQILRQVMSSKGIGVEDYLERQEYASVVEQLRQELKLSKNRVKDLDELLASVVNQDTDGLTTRNLQLQEMLQRQNKMLAVKQAMIDAFSRRCNEMEHQLKQVKLQSLMEDESSFSRNPQEIAASDKTATKTFATVTVCQKPRLADEKEEVAEKTDALSHAPLIVSSAAVASVSSIASSLVCSRCDREFDASDDEKYREHCTKCVDD